MAVTSNWYPKALQNLVSGATLWDWDTDDVSGTIKIALFNNSHTFDPDTQDYWNDVSANEASGTGYVAGGTIVSGRAINYDSATNTIQLRCTDPAWTGASFTAYHAVVYKWTGTTTTSPLIVNINFGGAETVTTGTFTVDFDASAGVATIAAP